MKYQMFREKHILFDETCYLFEKSVFSFLRLSP